MDQRQAAIERIEAKRSFKVHVSVFILVNAALIGIWLMSGRGYFWPFWPIAGWGIGLIAHGWAVYFRKPISEEEIRREMEKGG